MHAVAKIEKPGAIAAAAMPNAVNENSGHFRWAKRENCMDECKCFCWHSANNVYIIASTKSSGENVRERERDGGNRINLNVCQFSSNREYSANFSLFWYASSISTSPPWLCLLFTLLHLVYSAGLDRSHQHQLTWVLSA